MVGEPLQRVDNKLTIVFTECPDGFSGVAPLPPPWEVEERGFPICESLLISSSIRPFSTMGAGSFPRLINLSASATKHFMAGSDICGSSLARRREREDTQLSMAWSFGSIRGMRRVTTFMQDLMVSLCRTLLCSISISMIAGSPPASKTLSDSLAQHNSRTYFNHRKKGGGGFQYSFLIHSSSVIIKAELINPQPIIINNKDHNITGVLFNSLPQANNHHIRQHYIIEVSL